MKKQKTKIVHVTCPACAASVFDLRILKDEGIASAHCIACGNDYLILDSEDYWFDVIQDHYPRVSRCSCKSTSFSLKFEYLYRDDGDISSINVWSTCASCEKTKHQMNVEIDYGDTEDLVTRPLKYCKNPKVLYDLNRLNLFATRDDIGRIVHYMGTEGNCAFAGWLLDHDQWVRRELDLDAAKQAVLFDAAPLHYLRIYALPTPIAIPDPDVDTIKKEDAYWKRNEVIKFSSPSHYGSGEVAASLFYITFSNEYVEDGRVTGKSDAFRAATKKLMEWLKTEFVSWRGSRCFDNPHEHVKVFGDRFTSKGSEFPDPGL